LAPVDFGWSRKIIGVITLECTLQYKENDKPLWVLIFFKINELKAQPSMAMLMRRKPSGGHHSSSLKLSLTSSVPDRSWKKLDFASIQI